MKGAQIRITRDRSSLSADQLVGFFVGWPNPPTSTTLLQILTAAHVVSLAWSHDRIVGFVYAISDGVLSAYIPLLEVLPEHQGHGLGSRLVKDILAQLDDLYMIDLVCDPELEKFYKPHGFTMLAGMARRNYANQSGAKQFII